ncbi:bifunctional diguanylate cyclase/phosphodiesterase [Stutzerimonas nosocomialis]|uniref:putative bifunctional diguanylate cyclase/phosphodiesterase n=1 Tax=Stutzerimonas nosocomialis TaxID=1056496 RepID=UPI001109F7AC|nr:EAL domain-containing protein [Stutzerimonas nosocomialis]TLX58739.1 bifunctional diguanylate cyclase/phosphodiesterase [Stutzerimonas nosocomialis]
MVPLQFLSDMPPGHVALLDSSHSPSLVVLAYLIASAAAFTALVMANQVGQSVSGRGREIWRWVGALALGGGIWSMHFVAMLAFKAPIEIAYDHRITLVSLLIAVAVSYVVMRLLSRERLTPAQYLLAAVAAGVGIAAMHYSGMAAIRSIATTYYEPLTFALSVLIAIGASLAALVLAFHFRGRHGHQLQLQRVLCSLVMGLAIVSMHFTGMHAMTLAVPADQVLPPLSHAGAHSQDSLGMAIAVVALLIIAAGIAASWAERRYAEQRQVLDLVESQLNAITHYDPLTNLFNGRAFTQMVTQVLAAHQQPHQGLSVLVIDLDNFKRINDSLGHRAGDLALQQVAQRIRGVLGPKDVLARFSGDEFCILALLDGPAQAEQLAERILEQLRPPFALAGAQLQLTASIGISHHPLDGTSFDELFKHAGLAVGQCKASGRNRSLRFDPALMLRAREDLSLEQDLRRSLNEGLLEVHYQPIVDARDGRVLGLEALARWSHPQHGPISPERFVSLAEQHGFVTELDAWVGRRACADLRHLHKIGYDWLRVAVNCSALNLSNAALPRGIAAVLAEVGLEPSKLTLEVTENALMNNLNSAVEILDAIRTQGIKISIDDFGSGYSSLAYLRKLPVDTLKIDRSFIVELNEQNSDRAITAAIIAMAHKLELKVVAEGVEDRVQLSYLQENGCDMIQGYLFSRPLPLPMLVDWLAQRAPAPLSAPAAAAPDV